MIYPYRCKDCGVEIEVERSIHADTIDPLCGRCEQPMSRVYGCMFAPSAMPTRNEGARVIEIETRERRWRRDMDAYKRLVRAGHQPPHLDGAAALEAAATEPEHIAMGRTTARVSRFKEVEITREHLDAAAGILGTKVTEPSGAIQVS